MRNSGTVGPIESIFRLNTQCENAYKCDKIGGRGLKGKSLPKLKPSLLAFFILPISPERKVGDGRD